MKLLRAEFTNFRLLRDLELEFSTQADRNLTVIRAANETGKTTILHGLQWALYGDSALPGKGEDFRLHPIDWDVTGRHRVPITATVEFEVTSVRKGRGGSQDTRHHYRIIRSAVEEIDGTDWKRPASTVKLFLITDRGADPIDPPEAVIHEELPPELRDVFFTDGDRALSFIEADVAASTKRERVQRAIRSLLGLEVIESAIKHVKRSATLINKQAKDVDATGELNTIATRLEVIEDEISALEDELADAKEQFAAFDEKVSDVDQKISAALQKGDKEELSREVKQTRKQLGRLDDQIVAACREHSDLFRSSTLAGDLLSSVVEPALDKLNGLRDQGKIPNATIPILEDRLTSDVCICGEGLVAGEPEGDRRRKHIEKLIEDSRRADEIQGIVTELYFGAKSLERGEDDARPGWLDDYKKVVESRDGLKILRDETGRHLRALDLQIDALGDTDIQGLRETKRQYVRQRDRFLQNSSAIDTRLDGSRREREELSIDRDRLLRKQKKGAAVLAELEVTQDVLTVLQGSYERITTEELKKVSEHMSEVFLEMIGADPEQGAIITRAEISEGFDIIVYGPNQKTLNPDRDLNGASRRALTLAFILALTKVSGVEAPNVIDTPLGMTSGYVKRSILRTAIRESAQLILLLTPSEISGCEEILDESAGVVFTLTNPAHFPKMLIHDPKVEDRKVLRCDCSHREVCSLCERRVDSHELAEIAS